MYLNQQNLIPIQQRCSYLGYDVRDKVDYKVEGYDDDEETYQLEVALKITREDNIMVYLLILTQFFIKPLEVCSVYIQNYRKSGEPNDRSDGDDSRIEQCINTLHNDVEILNTTIVDVLLHIVHHLLCLAVRSFEDACQQCVKAVMAINSQVPAFDKDRPTTEVRDGTVVNHRHAS
jgi:hypothetical protein